MFTEMVMTMNGHDCSACAGTTACPSCDGYGHLPAPPDATHDEGPECGVCSGDGICVDCLDANK
jgi:hypothetical protein